MTREEELLLQGLQIELSKITLALNELKAATVKQSKYDNVPAWVNLDTATALKGGCSPQHIKNNLCLQPCCGTNYRLIGGRKSWRLNDVIEWLDIADSDLKQYAEKWKISLPQKYKRRSA
jgi:hypothetical protein